MDICSVADRNYLRPYATMLASIARNNVGRDLRFHLVTDGVDGPDLELFNAFCSEIGITVTFHHVDARALERICPPPPL